MKEKLSQEMFDSITREVVEEIGVPADSLVSDCCFLFILEGFLPNCLAGVMCLCCLIPSWKTDLEKLLARYLLVF